ncbi:MAG TPA: hypothetical protein VFL17_18985 [Anaerolineae bacterium]|nr:hypothetical protein [Anaerolineae bacterium]
MTRSEFEWQIAEEVGAAPGPVAGTPVKLGRRAWLVALAVVAAMAIAGTALLVAANRRTEEAIAGIKMDVLASHALAQRAANLTDRDLLDVVLDESPGWRATQHELLDRRLITGRDPFGFTAQPVTPEVIEAILSSDLKQAQVVSERAYAVAGIGSDAETVHLRHTFVFRFDGQRWRWSPLSDEGFWGPPGTIRGQRLAWLYPMHDVETVKRLARDAEAALGRICARMGSAMCPDDAALTITLATDPSSLIMMAAGEPARAAILGDNATLTLPAISLFGTPADEASYQALYRLYTTRIAAALAGQSARAARSQGAVAGLFYQAVNRAMIEEGLRPWPLRASGDPSLSPVSLPDQEIALYCVEDVQRGGDLRRYDPSTALRAGPATGSWHEELSDRIFTSLTPLPDDGGVILQEQQEVAGQPWSRIILWRDQKQLTVFDRPPGFVLDYSLGWVSSQSHNWLRFTVGPDRAARDAHFVDHRLLDLDSCRAPDSAYCESVSVTGYSYPVWSPDGSRSIVMWTPDRAPVLSPYVWKENTLLFQGSGEGRPLKFIGMGFAPFWLDDTTYGYISPGRYSPTEVFTATVAGDGSHVVSWADDVRSALPSNERTRQIGIQRVVVNPVDSQWLLIETSSAGLGDQDDHAFFFNRRFRDARRLPFAPAYATYDFSPDGRWLVVRSFDPKTAAWPVYVHDIEQNQTQTFTYDDPYWADPATPPPIDWSADGRWLLVLHDGVVHLIAPDHDYRRIIVPESPGCVFAAWINRR